MAVSEPTFERVRLLGADVDLVTADDVLDFTAGRVRTGRKGVIANHNAHSLVLQLDDTAMRSFFEMADLVEIDSTPLVAWGRLLGKRVGLRHRCTYLDWRDAFWRMAGEARWRVFFLGGRPGVAERAAALLSERYGILTASQHGYFDLSEDSSENCTVVDAINAFQPDVIMVGLGMPLQERWIAQNYARLERGVVFTVGGAFDYETGVQVAAPRWTGALGLEWLVRLAMQPRRLFRRYLIEPWRLLPLALADLRESVQPAARQHGAMAPHCQGVEAQPGS
jgi:N-acetylglucosaminyldiphosphoundecaprenol N-acetyl-beta-D-mannosaminyltransferase